MSMNPNDEKKPYSRKDAIDAAMANAPARNKGAAGLIGDTLLSGLSSAVAVPELAVGLLDIPTGGRVGKFLENEGGGLGFRPGEAKEVIGGWKSEQSQEQMREFQETEGFGGKLNYARKNPSMISNTVVESLAPMLAGGVVGRGLGAAAKGLSPVAAGALGEGAVGAGLAAEQIRQQTDDGLLTGKQAGLAAATGATTAGFGFAGGKIAQKLGIGDVDTLLASGSRTVNGNKGMVRRIGEGALTEGLLEELPQSVSETILQNEALGRPLDEGVTDAAVLGLLSGAAMGGVVGGITRNRTPARDDITPTEDMGQEAPRLGLPSPNRPGGNQLGYQGAISDPNNPNWIEDANPDYFNRGQGPNAANMRNLTPDPELTYNSELGGQFSAAADGTVFTESEYNEYLAQQQAQARAARDAGMSDINDVTQVPEGYDKYGSDPRLPAPDGTDFTASQDGQVYGRDDINTRLSQERDAAAERRARIARGEILDRTPIPEAPKPSELMGLDPNKGSLSAAAAIAVDSGASSVAADFEQASAQSSENSATRMAGLVEVETQEQPTGSKWLQSMRTSLATADIDNGTYQALSQSIEADPKSVPERARLKKAIDALPKKPEPTAKKIDPKARVIDEAKAQSVAYNPRGDKIPLQFDVVDASELLSSHSNNFVENPDYPQQYQPRDRADAGYQAQVLDIVKKFNPELLGKDNSVNAGSPIVGRDDNLVESGNGRTIAIRRMYESGKGDAYRQFVNKSAEEFGLDANAINQMQQPVLVRRNNSDMDREQFALRANAPTGAAMSSSERAKADAKILPNADLLELDSNGSLNLKGSYKFTQAFISSLDKNEVNELVLSNGELSQTGQNRVSGALLQNAYGSSKLTKAVTEDIDSSAKNVLKTLVDKAPQITKINQSIKEGNREADTLSEDIKTAAETYIDLVESGANIDDYLNMEDMFGEGISPQSKEIVRDFYSNARSATRMGSRLQARIDATNRVNAPDLLADFEADAPNVLSNDPAPTNAQTATQLTDENPTVNIPAPKKAPRELSDKAMVREMQKPTTKNTETDYRAALNLSEGQNLGRLIMSSGRVFDDAVVKSMDDKGVTVEATVNGKRGLHKGMQYQTVDAGINNTKSYAKQQAAQESEATPESKLAEKYGFNDSNKLDHGELSIPNRTKNIDSELDSYKADKAKIDAKKLDEVKTKNTEKAEAETERLLPIKEQAQAEYKQYGTAMVNAYKDKLEAQGVNARDFIRDEAKYNPESFLKLSKKFQEEQQDKPKGSTSVIESTNNPNPTGDWQTQVNGNEFRINEDGITVRKHDRVVHIRGANSITASKKAKELASQDIRELHYIAAKENPSDPFSEASIWLDGEGDMIRKKGTKKPTGSLLPILKQAESSAKPATKKADKPTTPTAPVAEIEDFGEKITGARKDMQSFYQKEMTDDDIISQPLSKIWPKKDIDAIEDTQMAALATALRSTIPTKPRKGYRLNSWVNKVKSTRGIMQNMLSSDMPANEFISQLTQIEAVADIGYQAQLLAQLDKEQWSRIDKVDPQIGYQKRNENGDYIPFVGFAVTIDKRTHTFNTEQRDISEIIDKVNNLLGGEVKTQALKFDLYSRGRGDAKSWFITQASDKDKTPLIEFNDRDAARAFLKENNSELSELWDQHKERVNVKKSDMRSNVNRERIGPDHRSGQDVTTEQFMNTFGLRGGQFGNWVKQGANSKDRQNMLNDAYDAFMDLAGVLNIPPEAIGLGGKLAMSFGARGKGRAMAHYEPSQVIINLTKTQGAGSLAHEWFHALDNHFTSFRDDPNRLTSKENAYITYKPEPMLIMKDQNGNPSRMRPITEMRRKQLYEMNKNRAYLPENFMPDPNHKEGVRPQVEVAFANLVETLDESPMKARAVTIDKGAPDGYWSRIIERAARAFEGYVINKLEKQGARSDFLANITPENAFPRNMDRYPYLLQSEMAPVAEAFDNLFATLDSKASEDGNGKTLFSRAGQLNKAIDKVKAGAIGSTQTTRQQVIGKLNDKFGKETIAKLMADGKLDIKVLSDFMQDGKLTIPSDVDGLYHNGKATLIADNLSDDMIIPTFLHELGGHGGMQTLMDKKAYDALMRDFDSLVKAGDPLAMQAKAMADKVARNEQDALDEYLPYLITLTSRQQAKQGKVAGMINRMVMAIRSWLKNTLGVPIAINSQDILSLAERMVNEIEKQGSLDNVANAAPQFSDPNIPDKQMQDVRDQYENTDQWMTAPNGKPTNLTENQWVQTRTPAFKQWFGDWQNDPKNASKIVDDNGEPRITYHQTDNTWTTFDKTKAKAGKHDNETPTGIFVKGSDRDIGIGENLNQMPLFTNIKNPLELKDRQAAKKYYENNIDGYADIVASMKQNDDTYSKALDEAESSIKAELKRRYETGDRSQSSKELFKKSRDILDEWTANQQASSLAAKKLIDDHLAENDIDGVVLEVDEGSFGRETDAIIAINNNQIKSATDNVGTFDGSNPDIRFSRAAGMNDQFDPRNIAKETATRLYDWASSAPPGKLSWWHKTIGTMYNLAQRNPYFKPVFENTEKFINDVSFYAAKASELAPRLLPQLDSLRDITKSAIGAKDNEALSKPIFEGTLLWGRDLDGKAVLIEDWRKKVMAASKQDRLQMLKDANRITPAQLQQLATLNNIQANRFINGIIDEEVNAGLVWKDSELRSKFDLSDEQIELYREFRSATDKSLDSLTRSDMLRRLGKDANDIEAAVMEAGTLREAVFNIEQHINSLIQANPRKEKALKQTLKDIKESQFRTNKLMDDGYAPLSRFGQYTVDVVDADGNREYFGMFESAYEARKMEAEMKALYDDPATHTVSRGTLSNEEFKLFAGVTPETAELFGEMLGLDATGDKAADEAFQEYLKRTKNNRSAMKRLMHRKGIKGYSEDVGRVLASFIYSNARHTSAALNMSNIDRAITDIPKGEGQLKDAAVKLAEYIKNPQEEAQLMRGWMFAQYLGGSIASAVVNITQPIAVSFPYLSQFGGAVKAASQLGKASSDWTKAFKDKDRSHFEPDLLAAIERAEADGTLSPQEVHNLLKQASGKNPLSAGDGTKVGDARALAGNTLSRVSLAWGALFSGAEQINRRVTFVAAYRLAKEQGMDNPADFATKSIKETQFVYNKASRMNWGRGAVGGTLMTFKTYTVSYIELMHRLWNQGEKGSVERAQGRKATMIMLGVMFLLSGSGGLPFMEDAEDLIDGIGQIMGYNLSSKKARQDFLDAWFGEMLGDFLESGASTLPGSPTDVSGRLGLGNLIPGTGIFKERTNNTRDVLEIAGPAGDFAGRIATGTRDIAKGVANLDATSLKKGALEFSPTAVRNAVKGIDMGTSGIYKDTKGYKVTDVSPVDAAFKFAGFQPLKVSKIQEANYLGQTATSFYSLRASNIRALWAAGVVEGNSNKVADAKAAVKDWNAKNPDQKIVIKPTDIARRVREMKMEKSERVTKLAPKSMRAQMASDFSQVRDGF